MDQFDYGRSNPLTFNASPSERPTPDYPEPAIVSIHRDVRDCLDGQPKVQEFVISNPLGDYLLCKLNSEAELTIRRVGTREVTFLHLPREFTEALVFTVYEWIHDIETWEYEQEAKALRRAKEQANGHGPTQDQTAPPTNDPTDNLIEDYRMGLLSRAELIVRLKEVEDRLFAKAIAEQATRQGAEPDEEPCGWNHCINPRKAGYSACREHIDAWLAEEAKRLSVEPEPDIMADAPYTDEDLKEQAQIAREWEAYRTEGDETPPYKFQAEQARKWMTFHCRPQDIQS